MKHINKWKIQSNMFFNQKIQWSVLKKRFFDEEYFSMKHSSKNIQWIIISMKSIFNETYGGQWNTTGYEESSLVVIVVDKTGDQVKVCYYSG